MERPALRISPGAQKDFKGFSRLSCRKGWMKSMGGNKAHSRNPANESGGSARTQAGGFTLIELLVVMAIMAILAALLLPALAKGKGQAQSAACKNHLKQIGIGLKMYASDYGWYPPLAEKGNSALCFDRLY